MSVALPNTTTTNDYKDCVLGGENTPYDRGALLIANNPASVLILRGLDRSSISQDEFPYITPTLLPLVRGEREYIFGVKVKSAIPGSPAQASGYLIEPGVAGLGVGSAFTSQVSAGGIVTSAAGVLNQIFDRTLTGAQASLDSQAILGGVLPTTFNHLQIWVTARTNSGNNADELRCSVNSLGGAIHNSQWFGFNNGAVYGSTAVNAGTWRVGVLPGVTTGGWGLTIIDIPNYNAGNVISGKAASSAIANNIATLLWNEFNTMFVPSAGPLTRFVLSPNVGSFIAGSRITCYGLG